MPERESFELVDLETVDVEQILELLRLALGSGSVERSSEFYRWKHLANPFGRSVGLGALDTTGRLIALRLFLRWRFRRGAGTVEAVRAVDTATHPDWQRRGLFRRLTTSLLERFADSGVSFVFNTPNPKSRAGYLAMGWRDVARLPLWVRPRPLRAARTWLLGAREHQPTALPPGVEPVARLLDENGLLGLLAAWGTGDERLTTDRSLEYLRWRYADAPGLRYGATWEWGRGGAAAIVRWRRRGRWLEMSISELLVGGSDGRPLAARLLRRLRGPETHAVALAAPSHERVALRHAGFVAASVVGPRLVARPLGPEPLPGLLDIGSWRLTAGDMEVF